MIDFNKMNLNISKIGFPSVGKSNKALLNQEIKDTFQSSKPSLKEAVKFIAELRNSDGISRFDKYEVENFKKKYTENKIDINTVKTFADTELNIDSISEIYNMQGRCGGDNFKKNEIPKIKERIMEFEQDGNSVTFSQSLYEPKEEYTLKMLSILDDSNIEKTYQVGKDLIVEKSNENEGSYKIEKSFDLRNNITSTKWFKIDNEGKKHFVEEAITKEDKNGKLIRKEEMKESDIKGVYNIKYTYPDGKTEDIVKASVNSKNGIKTIKKNLQSSNGTKTEFLYEDDPKGNRIIDYKITDKNGKVLMNDSQTFEVISDNKFISSKNHRKYEITVDEKALKVKDLALEKEAIIDFKTKVSNEKDQVISLLKKVSGDELFETVDSVSNLIGSKKEDVLDSGFSGYNKWINTGDNLFVFLHELGHAKDSQARTQKDVTGKKQNYIYRDNENIKKSYLKEKTLFNENYPDSQRDNMKYFLNTKNHYAGIKGGLSEVIAETNALASTYTNGEVGDLGIRAQYLQQHFPETIAQIKHAMEYKHDIEAIEYYGT